MKNRLRKRQLYMRVQSFKQAHHWMTDEEIFWEGIRPVGREFGSPDYETLAAHDHAALSAMESMAARRSTLPHDYASPLGRDLVAVLTSMPSIGLDSDFTCR